MLIVFDGAWGRNERHAGGAMPTDETKRSSAYEEAPLFYNPRLLTNIDNFTSYECGSWVTSVNVYTAPYRTNQFA
jgi:hypothetical protein